MKTEFKDISHGEDDKGKTFDHHCVLEVKTTDDDGNVTETKEQGYMIQGKDCIYLNAPKIYPPQDTDLMNGQYVPLMTDAQDIVGAINELFLSCSGGGDIFIVSGSLSGITVTTVKRRGEKDQELTVDFFAFNNDTYKTVTTLSAGNTSTERIWSKTIISEVLYNGETIWEFGLDDSGGVNAVFDRVGNDVLNGITGEKGESVLTSTPEGVALGWALAYNKEQNEALKKILDAYQDGIDDEKDIVEKEGTCDGTGDGSGSGDGSGDGSGSGGTGGGIKLPIQNFESVELPANTGTGCKLTYRRQEYYKVWYCTEYCDYAETYHAQSGLGIARYNGVTRKKNPDGSIEVSRYTSVRNTFTGVAGVFDLQVSGDIRDPEGILS